MPPKRMTANPQAPLRYRPGKAVGQEDPSSSEESDSESEAEQTPVTAPPPPPKATSFPKFSAGLTKEDLEARRQQAIAARAREAEAAKQDEEGFVTASGSDEGSGSDSGEEEDDDDDEDSSEDEAPQRKFIAPVFVSKSQRNKALAPEKSAEDVAAEEERRRKEKADELLQAQIEKDAAARAAGQRAWDDDDEAIADEVDDTDGLDPEAERAAWKLRELKRVKRDREAIELAEKEREEIERRRNLSAAEREAEDKAYIDAQNAEKDGKGKMGFMQKYFHKGAFFQGEAGDVEEEAKRRDIMGHRYADDAVNRELLPQYMQIRDMTKLGRKGRTKYKDLKNEDTGRWGDFGGGRKGPGDGGGDRYGNDREGATGANAYAVGERRRRDDERGGDREEKRPRYEK
ncbi:hypothetical protein MBLNU459_g4767t1 [Dothideomycetes sp. NU459]